MLAWQEMQDGRGVLSTELCDCSSGIADKIAIVRLPACPDAGSRPATGALLLAAESDNVVREHSWCSAAGLLRHELQDAR